MSDEAKYLDGAACPVCGGRIMDVGKVITCENNVREQRDGKWVSSGSCEWRIFKEFRGTRLHKSELVRLANGEAVDVECESRDGGMYTCHVALDPERGYAPGPKRDRLGSCPKCGGTVFAGLKQARCENNRTHNVDGEWVNDGSCDFHMFRTTNHRELDADQMRAILAGEEVFLEGLERQDGRRFSAWVGIDPDGRYAYTFPEEGESPAEGDVRPGQLKRLDTGSEPEPEDEAPFDEHGVY